MLSLRNRFGIPGVISVIALVFAMLGGAYAASNSSGGGKATASAKAKRGPKGPKGATGPAGPAGPAGPQGSAGANGKDGSNGANGSNGATGATGANGTSVTVTEEAPVVGECGDPGGIAVHSASPEAYVCSGEDGADGEPWTAGGTLPPGSTETGVWTVPSGAGFLGVPEMTNGSRTFVSISFPIPLASPPSFVVIKSEEEASAHPGCDGTVNEEGELEGGAVADPGTLCVYLTTYGFYAPLPTITALNPETSEEEVATTGVVLKVKCERPEGCLGIKGVWAVTG